MIVEKVSPEAWREGFAEKAHLLAFNENKPKESERVDFALVAVNIYGVLVGYVTCKEHDSKTIYLQFGGPFPGTRGTINTYKAYLALIGYCNEHYYRVVTYIDNSNKVMLKMAAKVGFRIVGTRFYNGDVLLEHSLDLKKVIELKKGA